MGLSPSANATLMLAADISGALFTCADNAACDIDPTVGQLALGVITVNNVKISGSLHTAQGIPGNPGFDVLSSSSLQIQNLSGANRTITVAVGATGFSAPATGFAATGSGTFVGTAGSTISLSYFLDALNDQGAENPFDTPGVSVAPFNDVVSGPLDSFSYDNTGTFASSGPYSMTLQFAFTLADQGRLDARGQALLGTVPEPVSLAILGTGLLGLAAVGRKRRPAT